MPNREFEARLKISAYDRTGNVFGRVSNKLGTVSRKANQANVASARMVAASRASLAMVARYAAPAVVAAGATKAVKDFAALERQMNRIGITAGATADETEEALKRVQADTKAVAMPLQDGIEALDTLVASGMSLEGALDFLPSVLATAQATGAATTDIANTGLKAADALEIEAEEMQKAFDIMVEGGKAGQFELKDMAQYIPNLANSFATLGYKGEDGLKKLIAVLQTLREDTGDASSAATQAGEVFGKIYSEQTAKAFKKMGVDLRKGMEEGAAAGKDALDTFIRLTELAIDGDLKKLPQLFTDKEFRLAMQSLLTSTDSLENFYNTMNSAEVDGTVFRDLQRILEDTQSDIDNMASSWDRMWTSMGKVIAPPASKAMNTTADYVDYNDAVDNALDARGMTHMQKVIWSATNMPLGGAFKNEELDRLAYEGGNRSHDLLQRMAARDRDKNFQQGNALMYVDWGDQAAVPGSGQPPLDDRQQLLNRSSRMSERRIDRAMHLSDDYFEIPDLSKPQGGGGLLEQVLSVFDTDKVEEGSREMGQSFTDGAEEIRKASDDARGKMSDVGRNVEAGGDDIVRALGNAATAIDTATTKLTGAAGRLQRRANANAGKSMKPEDNAPAGAY